MHKSAIGLTRNKIILQVKNKEKSVKDYGSYVPIGNAVEKLKKWNEQGAQIFYLTSRTNTDEINDVKNVLKTFNFPEGKLLFRKNEERYCDVVERLIPNMLIEDDCESIGGASEMTIAHLKPEIKKKIKSIIIEEFGGIDFLPDRVSSLLDSV